MRTRPLTGRLALAVLHRYPPAWRERYEREMTALIDDSTLAWTDAAELVRGMLEERAHELIQSDERPKRTAFVLSTLRCLFGVAFVGAVFVFAGLLRRLTGVPPESTAEALVFAWFLCSWLLWWSCCGFAPARRLAPSRRIRLGQPSPCCQSGSYW